MVEYGTAVEFSSKMIVLWLMGDAELVVSAKARSLVVEDGKVVESSLETIIPSALGDRYVIEPSVEVTWSLVAEDGEDVVSLSLDTKSVVEETTFSPITSASA